MSAPLPPLRFTEKEWEATVRAFALYQDRLDDDAEMQGYPTGREQAAQERAFSKIRKAAKR